MRARVRACVCVCGVFFHCPSCFVLVPTCVRVHVFVLSVGSIVSQDGRPPGVLHHHQHCEVCNPIASALVASAARSVVHISTVQYLPVWALLLPTNSRSWTTGPLSHCPLQGMLSEWQPPPSALAHSLWTSSLITGVDEDASPLSLPLGWRSNRLPLGGFLLFFFRDPADKHPALSGASSSEEGPPGALGKSALPVLHTRLATFTPLECSAVSMG